MAYFEHIPSDIGNSQICIEEFEKVFKNETKRDYRKNDKKIYNCLKKYGDEDKAFELAKNMRESHEETTPSKMVPSTEVDLLVKKILKK